MVDTFSNCSSHARSVASGFSSKANSTAAKINMIKRRIAKQEAALVRAKSQKDRFEPQVKTAFTALTDEDKTKQTTNRTTYENLKTNAYRARSTYETRKSRLKNSRRRLTAAEKLLQSEEKETRIQRTEDFVNQGGNTPPHIPNNATFTAALQQRDEAEKLNPFDKMKNWNKGQE